MKRLVFAAMVAVFAISAPVSAALRNVRVFPNPFRPSQGHTTVTFDGFTNGAEVKIYNAAGRLVFEKTTDASATSFVWNVQNDSGKDVASGMYIYYLKSETNEKTGKLGIVR